MKNHLLLSIIALSYLVGCAEISPIMKADETKSVFDGSFYGGETRIRGKDDSGSQRYRLHQQGATGFVPRDMLRDECEQRAGDFCRDQGKELKVLEETISHHAMVGPGNFPRAELVFVCLDKKNDAITFEDRIYIQLSNLKKLLDSGAITQDEYNQQKAKILK